jgi:HlyD family secretion protein
MITSWIRYVLPVASVGFLLMAFAHVRSNSQPRPQLTPPSLPAVAPFDAAVSAVGMVEAETQNIALGAALDGIVLEVFVPADKVGTHVVAGTPLFRIDDRHLKAQLASADAKLASAESELKKLELQPRPEEIPPSESRVRVAQADAERVRDEYQRAQTLVESRAISRQEFVGKELIYQRALHDVRRAEAEHRLLLAGAWEPDKQIARAAVSEARAERDRIATEIERATVRAPLEGDVLQVNVRAGEAVSSQSNTPLMVLGGMSKLRVRIDIDEQDIPTFRREARAIGEVRGRSTDRIALRFLRVDPYVVAKRSLTGDNTERVDVRVLQALYEVESPSERLFVGQQLDVFVEADAAQARGKTDGTRVAKVGR